MQVLIKNFTYKDNNSFKKIEKCILEINEGFLIIKPNCKSNKKEFYKISFNGWHNVNISNATYTMDSDKYIYIKTDILIKNNNEYELEHLEISFIPLQIYNLSKILDYFTNLNECYNLANDEFEIIEELKEIELLKLNKINVNKINVNKFKIENIKKERVELELEGIESLKAVEEEKKLKLENLKKERAERELKQIESLRALEEEKKLKLEKLKKERVERELKEIERLKAVEEEKKLKLEKLKKEREECKKKEIERLRAIEIEEIKLSIENFLNIYDNLNKDKKVENLFINFLKKYINYKFLNTRYYTIIANYLLEDNDFYNKSMEVSNKIFEKEDYEYYSDLFGTNYNSGIIELNYIDKIVDFIQRNYSILNRDYAKVITWIKLSEAATIYYSTSFYNLYGKEIKSIENLDINQCIYKYISLNISDSNQNSNDMFVYYLMANVKYANNKHYIICREIFNNLYKRIEEEYEYHTFINSILIDEKNTDEIYTIEDIDLMAGNEFEKFISNLFNKMGYKTIVTKASGDQGIDVIAEKNTIKIGIQTKCYSSNVSNSAIQEVVAGMAYYNCNKAMVITNNFFTNSAIELAKANNVVLWDREILKQKLIELF